MHLCRTVECITSYFVFLSSTQGGGGGAPKGLIHNPLMQFFTLGSSKIEVFEPYSFDIVIT